MNRKAFITQALGGSLLFAATGGSRLAAQTAPGGAALTGGRISLEALGATPNGSGLCTLALQKAIDLCHENGGGTVVIPAGRFITGTVRLRSFVALELQHGAVLLGSTRSEDYPRQPVPQYRSLNDDGFRALIYAEGEENIGLYGQGCIDGQGANFGTQGTDHDGRPRLIQFVSCREVRVEGLRLRNSALWMQHYLNCENVQIRGLNVWNHANHNNDMIDIDGCRQVTIADCIGDSDDDGITLKSTGLAPCENVAISNCVVSSHCNALKCGTESAGGFRNIVFANCVVKPSAEKKKINGRPEGISGIALELVDGGILEGVTISNIAIEGTMAAIFVRLGSRGRGPTKGAARLPVGILRNVRISNVLARGVGSIGSSITGLPEHHLEDVTLTGIRIELAAAAEGPAGAKSVPEKPTSYPEARMWGPLPAYGFFVRHATRVRFFDVTVVPAAGERRPRIVAEDVTEGVGLET